jgi:hypothetical protein
MSKIFFISVWRKSVFVIYFEFELELMLCVVDISTLNKTYLIWFDLNMVLLWQLFLPILFQYCYKYCYSDSRNIWAVMKAGGLAL